MTDLAAHPVPAAEDVCCPGTDCELLPRQQAEELATVFRALADPTRVRLLQYLAGSDSGTACACHLPGALGITQPTLSFHMRKLHDAGLVDREKRGRWVHYTVRPDALERARSYLALPPAGAETRCC
ncbi:ArsR/SmtB family transcription factor [Ornithinimicrobium cerasi]|uniref:Transcriptional regulator, ArsR family n=1 Tax=Ornithinimicrobium cerasi TaxID=2248773 RepID=A0A285W0C3_9MICO|nr:metalloregulator ArsR/SmtB family transcription factor [Ornithinimicrobium cerasi]SOC58381.1 transcriptional regulator, ArsR family [Ornithinimicrobium cerasi]